MEWLIAKLGVSTLQYAAGGIGAVAVAWILKKIPNKRIKAQFGMIIIFKWTTHLFTIITILT